MSGKSMLMTMTRLLMMIMRHDYRKWVRQYTGSEDWLYYLHQLTKLVAVLLTWRFLMSRSKRLNDLWSSFLENALRMARLIPFL
ncbi:GD11210 [Drosophila simulans]|uniref:GD11210 n=1 Tax=Drosophila simulans TaxID=7240 RepID=B4QI14_DROSI|nr:GD11210 [Drosophila simulans]